MTSFEEKRYELSARGFKTTNYQTVKDSRSPLQPHLRLEKVERSLEFPEMKLEISEELAFIDTMLTELSTEASQPNFSGVQIFTRVRHLRSRLDRLLPRSDGDVTEVNVLREKVSSLLQCTENEPKGEDLTFLLAEDPND